MDKFIFGELPSQELYPGCLRLSKLSGTALLGINFISAQDGTRLFANANPMPDLRIGGQKLLDALATLLSNKHLKQT
jgi:hypothetical protein